MTEDVFDKFNTVMKGLHKDQLEHSGQVFGKVPSMQTMSHGNTGLGLGARGLKDKDWGPGVSDPYVVISRPSINGGYQILRTSETKKNTLNPDWNHFLFTDQELNGGDNELKLKFEVFDDDGKKGPDGKDQLLGTGYFSVKELEASFTVNSPLQLGDGKSGKPAGNLVVRSVTRHQGQQATGYPTPGGGYPPPGGVYPAPGGGYPAPGQGYPAPGAGYAQPTYPAQPMGAYPSYPYTGAGGGPVYPPAGPGYPPAGGPGYPPAGGPGYPPAGGPGYPPAGGPGYPPAGGPGYPPAGGPVYPPAGGFPYPPQ